PMTIHNSEIVDIDFLESRAPRATSPMLIRVGYEIAFHTKGRVPMLLQLSLHPSREGTVVRPGGLRVEPATPIESYQDAFGNVVHRIIAPGRTIRLRDDLVVRDDGRPDPASPGAEQYPVEELPTEVLQYLLASRYCEVDRLSETAWGLFGDAPTGWRRV